MARLLADEPAFGTDAGPVFPDAALGDVDAALARGDPRGGRSRCSSPASCG
jgi:hypothetical protein